MKKGKYREPQAKAAAPFDVYGPVDDKAPDLKRGSHPFIIRKEAVL